MVQAIGKGRKTRSITEIQMNLDQTQIDDIFYNNAMKLFELA